MSQNTTSWTKTPLGKPLTTNANMHATSNSRCMVLPVIQIASALLLRKY
jgi:hypothetical protein